MRAFFLCNEAGASSLAADPKGKAEAGMSEALSSSEIEDVLSSIRRLVSDDMRPSSKGPAPAVQDGDKLLLTPALRVVQSDAPAAEAAPALEEVVLAVSAGVDQQSDQWESEIGDLAPVAEVEAGFAEDVNAEDWESHRIDAYAEPVASAAPAEILSDGTEDEPAETGQILSFADAVAGAPLPGWAQSAGADEADDVQPDPWIGGTVEPDAEWADQAEAAVLQELTGAAPKEADADEIILNEAEVPEVPVDEAMLREIVRDVLRDELQGRLGERITRNIRKLVRAEIARVMASEEFL